MEIRADDPIWQALYEQVQIEAAEEPILASYLHAVVL
ncbi:MAG: serine O-acetyltransferase, partial [Deltaproteobacteria bacterium]|nr:serine O-acetyltransferase [Deltaproteobacteria bacterium]